MFGGIARYIAAFHEKDSQRAAPAAIIVACTRPALPIEQNPIEEIGNKAGIILVNVFRRKQPRGEKFAENRKPRRIRFTGFVFVHSLDVCIVFVERVRKKRIASVVVTVDPRRPAGTELFRQGLDKFGRTLAPVRNFWNPVEHEFFCDASFRLRGRSFGNLHTSFCRCGVGGR